jgi:hypothetical protein
MIKLRIVSGNLVNIETPLAAGLVSIARRDGLAVDGTGLFHHWKNSKGDTLFLLGTVIGVRQADGTLAPPFLIKSEPERLEDPKRIPEVEGRFVLVKISPDSACEVWTDQFGRMDIYWQSVPGGIVLATDLNLLPISKTGGKLDNIGVAHALTVYGSRPARQHTLYEGVCRLGVNQGIRIFHDHYEILKRHFRPTRITQYSERDLNRYTEVFLEAIRARASSEGNIVSLSSGWDSTSILACLVHLFGRQKIRAVIGRMRYSERSGVINQFEINRAQAFADYFGVHLEILELDYRTKGAEYFEEAKDLFQSQQLANLSALGQWLIAKGTAKTQDGGDVLFTGEMSDGAHNLGFSQFVSIFHPASLEFREYGDKMASYLFGPTFLEQLLKGTYEQDPVWQLFKQRNVSTKFDQLAQGEKAINKQLLASFFLRGGRIPLYSLDNTRLLAKTGREIYASESERIYLEDICDQVTKENLYAWYLHLYNSFHWQSATVLSREYTAEAHGLRSAHPFHDSALIDFLSGMPETWGRGLDLNPTKYPLKWMLRNRIDYPYQLQVGPHSYTYDVNPNFSLLGEILYASSLKDVFREALREGKFLGCLDDEIFDHAYIDGVVKCYLKGEELRGQEMNDLGVLAMHSAIGVYGQ